MERSPLFIQSFDKVMRVLEAFSQTEQYLGLGEIVALTGFDKPQAQRCTHTLVETGYLEKHPQTGRFCLGKKCLDLSFHFLRTHPLVTVATPILLQLRRDCGERTNLSLFDGTTLVYVIRLHGKREYPQFSTLMGRRMATFCSAGGRAMLAALPDDEVRAILAQSDLKPMTADTVTDPERIMVEIGRTRARGYGFVVNESAPSEVTVAAAVRDAAGRPVAAVHIAGSLTKWEPGEYEKRFSPFAVETARALSHAGAGQIQIGRGV
ncbi:IclR family transcriptional regulator [Labrys monachus]|uniref:DNA-binding IclR family transcriptional regulator n=1 Tax=Labrys monachus TaxID=217067 RepID=A0ABU0FIS8_9HYPH|nr:IclR family transcriptional regulator [Labrys monachus]MDQ0394416.1 DNA-binding IclR family transcriptional regulator [Labrys monachus]